MKTLALSGWGQPHDALSHIAPDAHHLDYAHSKSVEEALALIAEAGQGVQRIIGWSLGGQLAVRAIAAKLIAPKQLVLIAVPFQFVADSPGSIGMKRDLYDKFLGNYARAPERTLSKAWELIVKGDAREEKVRGLAHAADKQAVMQRNWLRWLELLDGFSCAGLAFSHFPPTFLVQGAQDAVVGAQQMEYFAGAIPGATSLLLEDCGHAPHWHAPQMLKERIEAHV